MGRDGGADRVDGAAEGGDHPVGLGLLLEGQPGQPEAQELAIE